MEEQLVRTEEEEEGGSGGRPEYLAIISVLGKNRDGEELWEGWEQPSPVAPKHEMYHEALLMLFNLHHCCPSAPCRCGSGV